MVKQRRRPWLLALLVCCIAFGALGSLAVAGAKTNRFRRSPPAELLDLGPVWIGDFCRDNVAQRRHPAGWCPRDYTVYVVLRIGSHGSIHPIFQIPDTPLEVR